MTTCPQRDGITFPPSQRLFDSQQAAHDHMMLGVGDAMRELKGTPAFPTEKEFIAMMKVLWVEVYQSYCPTS